GFGGAGCEVAGRSGDSTSRRSIRAPPPGRAEGPRHASRSQLLPNGPEPFAGKQVAPSLFGSTDLFGEAGQQRLDPSVGPFQEHLGDQVVRGRVTVVTDQPVRELHLGRTINVEDTETNPEALCQSPSVSHRQRDAMRAPLGEHYRQLSGPAGRLRAGHVRRHPFPRTLSRRSVTGIGRPHARSARGRGLAGRGLRKSSSGVSISYRLGPVSREPWTRTASLLR